MRGPARARRWSLALLATGLLLVLLALTLRTLERPVELTLAPDAIVPVAGHAFQIDLKRTLPWPWQPLSDHLGNPYRSALLLFEDGVQLGPPHAEFDAVQQIGHGYLHWGRLLIFASSDGSDPRANGRSYHARLSAGVAHALLLRLANGGTVLAVIGLAGWLWSARAKLAHAGWSGGRRLWRRLPDYGVAALIPSLLSGLALLLAPPLWNGSDSTIWLLWQLEWIPHHPPLYPFFMALVQSVFDQAPQILRTTQWVQHLLSILAITYLASAYRVRWQILLVAALAALGTSFNLFAHGFFTEGLANPLTLFFLGALLRLRRDGLTLGVATALGLTLLAASLSRHALLVLGALPVAYLILLALFSSNQRPRLFTILQAGALVVSVVAANGLITRYVVLQLDAQQTSILGRAGVYRLQEAYQQLPPGERDAWLATIAARTTDPAVRHALPVMAITENPWTGPHEAIRATPELYGHHPDALMNAAFKTFAFAPDPQTAAQWGRELQRALLGVGSPTYCPGQINCLLTATANSIDQVFPLDPRNHSVLLGTGAEFSQAAELYRALADTLWVRVLDDFLPLAPPQRLFLLVTSLILGLLAIALSRDGALAAMILTLWFGALLYALALTFITVVLPRYLSPIDILLWLGNGLSLVAILARGDATARPSLIDGPRAPSVPT
ncbi:hypothetical protein CKO25_09645 [Thiocapsa imhoffii]|uniref:Uncharacterized protein n=1 Tax=Thiocapsa imhoffii TaxID=382777 RepID=A0A9X0WHZ3_9GAMM|nr:hypothetical protein [Thiocapsa imhoffii]